jgi:4-hydroxyisophthalate hydroxylase
VNSFEPNYEGSSIVGGPAGAICSAIGSHQFAARAGHHLAPHRLASGRNVFEELGDGFTLLDLGAPDAATAIWRAAEAKGVPLRLVRDDSAEAREFYRATLVLVRPDQFVAWVSDGDVADATGMIGRVVGGVF